MFGQVWTTRIASASCRMLPEGNLGYGTTYVAASDGPDSYVVTPCDDVTSLCVGSGSPCTRATPPHTEGPRQRVKVQHK